MRTSTRPKITSPAYYYAAAKLVTPERHRLTLVEVEGAWDSEDEASAALESECESRGVSMQGRRVIFTVIPQVNGQWLAGAARTLDRWERPLWTVEDLRRAQSMI
jgi:hypothetical protein